jgi:hypothetical protein
MPTEWKWVVVIWWSESNLNKRGKACPSEGSRFWNASFILDHSQELQIYLLQLHIIAAQLIALNREMLHTRFICHCKGGSGSSSVGIATHYGLHGLGFEPQWGNIFRNRPDRPWGPPSLLYHGYGLFYPGVKWSEYGVDYPPTHLATRLKK